MEANSVDPDQTAPSWAADLCLHCLPTPACPKTWIHYSKKGKGKSEIPVDIRTDVEREQDEIKERQWDRDKKDW